MNRPLRLCVVSETHVPEINGVALMLERLLDELRRAGIDVSVVRPRQRHESRPALRAAQEMVVAGFPLPGYPALRFGFPALAGLWRRFRRDRPDVVHLVTEGPLGWAALFAARLCGIPTTSSFHTNFPEYGRHYGYGEAFARSCLRAFHNLTRKTLAPTPALAAELEGQGYRRLGLLGRGVDTRRFRPEQRDRELREMWRVEAADPVVLHVGRLAPEKNVELLIELAGQLERRAPRARLVVVGDGPSGPRLRAAMPRAIFCGQVVGGDLAAHYASADVFVFPSLTDTFGNVVLEAMASGLPVVAFDRGAAALHLGAARGFDDNVAPGDRDGMIQRTVELALDPRRRRAVGARSCEVARSLSWERVARAFLVEIAGAGAQFPISARHFATID
jgi:glycosyltransferase involved in cell wall biosynthesis